MIIRTVMTILTAGIRMTNILTIIVMTAIRTGFSAGTIIMLSAVLVERS
jgi:hypothetical protein